MKPFAAVGVYAFMIICLMGLGALSAAFQSDTIKTSTEHLDVKKDMVMDSIAQNLQHMDELYLQVKNEKDVAQWRKRNSKVPLPSMTVISRKFDTSARPVVIQANFNTYPLPVTNSRWRLFNQRNR